MEITELQVKNKTWWRLRFDGIGKKQEKLLQSIIHQILVDFPVSKLSSLQSFGYPKFLSKL